MVVGFIAQELDSVVISYADTVIFATGAGQDGN
jgi:hypothetical protein